MNWNEVFEYNDGKLYWKITKGATKKGAEAGTPDRYLKLRYNYR
jgi:hypothetical protein